MQGWKIYYCDDVYEILKLKVVKFSNKRKKSKLEFIYKFCMAHTLIQIQSYLFMIYKST